MKLSGFTIIRPLNCIFIFFLTLFAYNISIGHITIDLQAVLSGLSISLIAGGGNALNDFFDYKIDIKNKPYRPIPSKQISRKEALLLSLALFALGLFVSSLVNSHVFLTASIATSALLAYGVQGRHLGFSGDILISFLTALVFIQGAFALSPIIPYSIVLIAAAAFSINVSREVVKDLQDYDADRGIKLTLPQKIGKHYSALVAMLFLVGNLFIVYVLLAFHITGVALLLSLPIVIFIVIKVAKILKMQNSKTANDSQKMLKLIMFIEFIFVVLDVFVINLTV